MTCEVYYRIYLSKQTESGCPMPFNITFFIISLQDDYRRYIALSTFGFYEHGELDVKFHNFQIEDARENGVVSTISRSVSPISSI